MVRYDDRGAGAAAPALRRAGCCRSGGAAVEFALIIPVLLLIVAGIAELGRVLYVSDTLANAVREGGRAAMVRGASSDDPASEAEIRDLVRARAPTLAPDAITVDVAFNPNNNPGSTLTIDARYSHVFVMPPFSAIGSIQLERSTSIIIAN